MIYNTERKKLIIPEYGRYVQNLVDHLPTIENREERTKAAKAIVEIMTNAHPELKSVKEYEEQLWDQLYLMSGYSLDIDFPFPILSEEEKIQPPKKLEYPTKQKKYRYYGKNIQKMIDKALEWEDGEKKEALIWLIANHMKKCYLTWNKELAEDTLIFEHLKEFSGGKIDLLESSESLTARANKKVQAGGNVASVKNNNRRRTKNSSHNNNNNFKKRKRLNKSPKT